MPDGQVGLRSRAAARRRQTPRKAGAKRSGLAPAQSPRSEAEELSALIETVYDAALDGQRWVEAVRQACRFLNCVAGALGAADILQGSFNFTQQWGYAPIYWQSYLDHYSQTNPLNGPAFRTQIGQVIAGTEIDTWEELLVSSFQKEWAEPQGFVDLLQGTLDKSASGVALLTFARHKSAGPIG